MIIIHNTDRYYNEYFLQAYFYTPFPKLHITAEGGSTLTFQRLVGQRKVTFY